MIDIFTVADVVRLLERVQGRSVWTARAVRYYARTGMVQPSHRIAGDRGARLYTLTDIALLRLAWLLRERWQLHERAVWGLLVYRGAELRALFASGRGTIVVDDWTAVSPGAELARMTVPIRIPVSFVLEGLASAAIAYRRRHQQLWTGAAWVSASAPGHARREGGV
jgi:hypothetical protein